MSSRLLAACLLLVPAAARAQSATETPEQVAGQFMAAMRDTNWVRMASLLHPSALSQFRDLMTPFMTCPGPEVEPVRQELFGTPSSAEVSRMSDTVLMASLFRFGMTREGLGPVMASAQMQVLGHIPDGRDTVHTVTRITFTVEGTAIRAMEVLSFARHGTTWRGLLKADFSALIDALRGLCQRQGD